MRCPACQHKNLEGSDECEKCGLDLSAINIYTPKSQIEESLIQDPVIRLKPRPAITVEPKTSIMQVVQLINKNKSSVLVVEQNNLIGIVTERDVLYKAMDGKLDLTKTPVSHIMTPNPETIHNDDSIACALNIMSVGGFRNIPIMQNDVAAYVVSIWDILRYIAEQEKI